MLDVFDPKGIKDLDQRFRQVVGSGSFPGYTVEPVPSGIQVLLAYEGGGLSRAVAREVPFAGEDITRNVRTILSIPLKLDYTLAGGRVPDRFEVWGVVYQEGGNSPIEGVAASLIGADLRVTAKRPLNLFCYGAMGEPELGKRMGVDSHYALMLTLQGWGFRVNRPQISRCADISSVIETIGSIQDQKTKSPFEMAGALVQVNSLAQRLSIEQALKREGAALYRFTTPSLGRLEGPGERDNVRDQGPIDH